MERFLVKYAGHGVSVGRECYHDKKRPDETPLEYVYRLNEIVMQANTLVKTVLPAERKEHIDRFIDTLEDPDLASQLMLLRVE